MISDEVQQEFFAILADLILKKICCEIKQAGAYSFKVYKAK